MYSLTQKGQIIERFKTKKEAKETLKEMFLICPCLKLFKQEFKIILDNKK